MEELLIETFIASHRRSRWLTKLASAKRRQFLDGLNHCADFDPRYTRPVPASLDLLALLRSRGAPTTCYVVSDSAALDGREMALEEAISAVEANGWGTLISCVPGRLACYIDEAGTRRRLLLVRTAEEANAEIDTTP